MTAEREKDIEQIVKLTAVVINRTHGRSEDNDFEWSHYPNDDHETGSSWVDFEIEAVLLLTDDPQNSGFHLERLRLRGHSNMRDSSLFQEMVEERYRRQIEELAPGNTVELSINFISDQAWPATRLNLEEAKEARELEMKAHLVQIKVLSSNPQN